MTALDRLQPREKRLVMLAPVAIGLILVLRFGALSERRPDVVAAGAGSVPTEEQRLNRLRQTAAIVPGKEDILKRAKAELDRREKGVLVAETAPQAQAQLLQIIRRVAERAGIDARGAEEKRVGPLSEDYGEVSVAVTFSCRIEQLINFLADLANQPELLATHEIRINSANAKEKTIGVRLALSGVAPRRLVPEKKGASSF